MSIPIVCPIRTVYCSGSPVFFVLFYFSFIMRHRCDQIKNILSYYEQYHFPFNVHITSKPGMDLIYYYYYYIFLFVRAALLLSSHSQFSVIAILCANLLQVNIEIDTVDSVFLYGACIRNIISWCGKQFDINTNYFLNLIVPSIDYWLTDCVYCLIVCLCI